MVEKGKASIWVIRPRPSSLVSSWLADPTVLGIGPVHPIGRLPLGPDNMFGNPMPCIAWGVHFGVLLGLVLLVS